MKKPPEGGFSISSRHGAESIRAQNARYFLYVAEGSSTTNAAPPPRASS